MPLGKAAKVGVGWVFCTIGGFYSFYWAKNRIEKQRYDNMKARQRMRQSNQGTYDPSPRKFSSSI